MKTIIIIILAIAGTAAGAVYSHITRNQYIDAALLSEAHELTSPLKPLIAEYYLRYGSMPDSNAAVGLAAPETLYGTSVKRVAINPGGVMHVDFDDERGARSMQFSPVAAASTGIFSWRCTSDSLAPAVLEKLRPTCSHLPLTPERRLMKAVAAGSTERVTQLLADDVDVNAVVNGNTPVQLAASLQHLDIMSLLLAHDADIPATIAAAEFMLPPLPHSDDAPRTQMVHAMQKCHHTRVLELLLLWPDISLNEAVDGQAPLINAAVLAGCTDLVAELITKNSLVDQLDDELIVAMVESAPEDTVAPMLNVLLQAGIDINASSRQGDTALAAAIACERPDVAELLVSAGAGVNRGTAAGSYPIIEATKKGNVRLVEKLVQAGAAVNVSDKLGRTATVAAVAQGKKSLVDVLLLAGANPHLRDNNGISATILAHSDGQREIHNLIKEVQPPTSLDP